MARGFSTGTARLAGSCFLHPSLESFWKRYLYWRSVMISRFRARHEGLDGDFPSGFELGQTGQGYRGDELVAHRLFRKQELTGELVGLIVHRLLRLPGLAVEDQMAQLVGDAEP